MTLFTARCFPTGVPFTIPRSGTS